MSEEFYYEELSEEMLNTFLNDKTLEPFVRSIGNNLFEFNLDKWRFIANTEMTKNILTSLKTKLVIKL